MPGFLYRMPAGIPGEVNRVESLTAEAQVITPVGNAGAPPTVGIGIVIDATTGNVRTPLTTADTTINGFLMRAYPTQQAIQAPAIGDVSAPIAGPCTIMKRGYMTVQLNGSAAATKQGAVYVRVGGAVTGKPLGGIEAAVDGTTAANTLLITSCYFTGPADSNGIVEIAYKIN